jgi:hypothetical protein
MSAPEGVQRTCRPSEPTSDFGPVSDMGITGHRSTILLYSHLISPSLGGVLLRNRPSDQPVRFRWRGFDLKEKARWRTDMSPWFSLSGIMLQRVRYTVEPFERCSAWIRRRKPALLISRSSKPHSGRPAALIARKRVPAGTNYHVTSRDVVRKLIKSEQIEHGEQQ